MDTYKYLIVGGGMAGERAVEGIRKEDPDGPIALIAGEPHLPYDRPPLSKGYLTGEEGRDKVYLRPADFYTEKQVTLRQGLRATALDPAARRVTLADGQVLGYEKLLLATGGTARQLPIPGRGLPGVFTLRTLADADAIRAAAQPGKRALVVGGSFIGSEVAAALAMRELEVTVVFPEARLLEKVLPEELSAWLHGMYTERGVRFLTVHKPARLEGAIRMERAVLDDGTILEADLAVAGIGITLNTDLARSAGLKRDEGGAVRVDEFLRTSDPHIYAAGDIASWPDPTFGKRLRVEHWDVARRQGRHAGGNMAGAAEPYTAVPYFYSDLFHYALEAWGDLTAWERTVQRGEPESGHFFLFYFNQGRLTGVLVGNPTQSERKLMPKLVGTRGPYAELAGKLADEQVGLEILGEVASNK